jgi:hypothetical protein
MPAEILLRLAVEQRYHRLLRHYLYFSTGTASKNEQNEYLTRGSRAFARTPCSRTALRTSAYVSIRLRQHTSTSAYVSIRQQTSCTPLRASQQKDKSVQQKDKSVPSALVFVIMYW